MSEQQQAPSAHLEISQVSKVFDTQSGMFKALDNVHVKIAEGEFISLIGHSGCGKSTVLNIVAGLTDATEGGVILEGREVRGPGPERAVVFQNHALFPWLTVYENVAIAVKHVFRGRKTKAEMRDWILHNLELVHMGHAADKRPDEISGGMKQRVGIARALAMEPRVLLMDEPFGALDALTRAHLQDSLMEIHQRLNNTVIMITHDVDEAVLLSDRIVMMTNGPAATVGEILQVDLLRPRKRLELADDPHYNHLRAEVLHFLHERHAKPDVPASAPADSAEAPADPDTAAGTEQPAARSSSGSGRVPAGRPLEIGYIPLTDAAPLVVAHELGLFRQEGVDVSLVRETSWASIRDKVAIGMLDGAQMLAPMPLAASVGAGGPKQALTAPMTLSQGGNGLTVSRDLFRDMCDLDPDLSSDRRRAPAALRTVVEQRAARGRQRLTFGVVFPSSSHNYLLRHWLASGGIDPDRDVRLVVIPPPQMVTNLDVGNVAGFCVGEPWNTVAVERGIGVTLATSAELWPDHVEKVFGVGETLSRRRPEALAGLLRALNTAGRWLEDRTHIQDIARLLASPHYLNQSVDDLLPTLSGQFRFARELDPEPVRIQRFTHDASARPDAASALWWLTQMYRWGQLERPVAMTNATAAVYGAEVFDQVLGAPAQASAPNTRILGPEFDPARPLDYLNQLPIDAKPAWLAAALGREAA